MTDTAALAQYVAKLERRGPLPPDDRAALLALSGQVRTYAAGETIIEEGAASTHCVIVETGLVSRVKLLERGARQIVAFHFRGDAVDLQQILFTRTDHRIQTHSPSRTYWVRHEEILNLTVQRPYLARALWLDTLVEASIFREWTANVGQRKARERIAHLFLEMAARSEAVGLSSGDTFDLPITQNALAEALGLSLVHMNNSLQALRKDKYLSVAGRTVTFLRRDDLAALSGFDANYLHIDSSRTNSRALHVERAAMADA